MGDLNSISLSLFPHYMQLFEVILSPRLGGNNGKSSSFEYPGDYKDSTG